MSLFSLFKSFLNPQKKIDLKKLPSLGLFYQDDFEISIKKANLDDIIEYEHGYVKDDIGLVIKKLKRIVSNNTIFPKKYDAEDIKSIDVVFIFLEIVRITKGKPISLRYFDKDIGVEDNIEFSSAYFNYFKLDDSLMHFYDINNKQFIIDEYRFSLPSMGLETCLTNFLIDKSTQLDSIKYNNYDYDFTYFLSDKKRISFSEIENLIHIFNFDIDVEEKIKIKKIIGLFQPIQRYSLRKGSKIIEINSQIDLENIWK